MLFDPVFWQSIWYLTRPFVVIGLLIYFAPRILRGMGIIWREWRDIPPFSWWRALPDWCSWGIVMTAVALAGPFSDPPHGWDAVVFAIIFIWSCVGLTHGFRAIDRILSAHFDNRRLRREQRLRTEGRDEPFQAP